MTIDAERLRALLTVPNRDASDDAELFGALLCAAPELLAVFEAACAVHSRRLSIKSKLDRDDRTACDVLGCAVDAARYG